jgi:hypothetical protein
VLAVTLIVINVKMPTVVASKANLKGFEFDITATIEQKQQASIIKTE